MTADNDAATRRIMAQLGEPRRLPYLGVREGNAALLIGGPIVGLFTASLLDRPNLTLPLVGLGFGVTLLAVVAAPAHRTAPGWLRDVLGYLRRDRTMTAARQAADEPTVDPGTSVSMDRPTQDLTGIRRVWPRTGIVERPDGTLEGWLELHPGHMEFAMSDDWASVQATAAEFADDDLGFDLTLHATTRAFPVEQVVAHLDARLTDPDVRGNPVVRSLLEEYREQRPAEMRERGTQRMRYYIGVTVRPSEVASQYRTQETPLDRLQRVPLLGLPAALLATRREGVTDDDLRRRCHETLETRLDVVRTGLVDDIHDWSAHRLSAVETLSLAAGFWTGDRRADDDAEVATATAPTTSGLGHEPRDSEVATDG